MESNKEKFGLGGGRKRRKKKRHTKGLKIAPGKKVPKT